MIIVKLWGGLGNQFFQYAYAYQLAKKLNTQLVIDTSWFKTQSLREPEIFKFNIEYLYAENTWDINSKIKMCNKRNFNRILRLPSFAKYQVGGLNYLKESRFCYNDKINNYILDNTYLDGYWQCPRYFEWVRSDLLNLFKINNLDAEVIELGEQLKEKNSVSIHVRRGDYPKKKLWYSRLLNIDDKYYKKAIVYLKQRTKKDLEYYIFSNDIKDAQNMLGGFLGENLKSLSINRPLSALEEWYLMGCCRNQIIGNSTFSWWSAYLNRNDNKIICAPNGYVGNENIYPEGWKLFELTQ